MSTNKKWDDASQKDLLFAMLMSTGDGNIKADWKEVEKIMTSWGYTFTIGAMSQHWSKTIQKAFKERHPDKKGGNADPATPKTPKTPVSNKGKGKGLARKRLTSEEDTSPHASAKKVKLSQDTDVDDEEHVMVKGETETEEDYNHSA